MATSSPDMAVLAAASAGIDRLNSLISAMSSRSHQQFAASDTISQFQQLISLLPAKSGHARFRRAPQRTVPNSLSPQDLVAFKSDSDLANNSSPSPSPLSSPPSAKYPSISMQIDLNAPPSSRESSDSDCSSPAPESTPSANPNSVRDDTAASISGSNHFIDLNMEASQYSVNSTSVFSSPFKISNGMLREGSSHGVSSIISDDNACFEGSTSKKVFPSFLLQKTGNGDEDSSLIPRSTINFSSHTPLKIAPLNIRLPSKRSEINFDSHCSDGGQSTDCTEDDSGFAGTVIESGLNSEFALVDYKPMDPSSKIHKMNYCDQTNTSDKVLSSCVTSEFSWPSSAAQPMQKFSLTVMDHNGNSLKRKSTSKPDSQCHCAKRKKSKNKVVKLVPAISEKIAEIPPDDHSWRKYGQKPIKGSPYPRGYYKCSGMKGCPAKKHVERSLDNPSMLKVTYEGEHIHPRPTSFEASVKVA